MKAYNGTATYQVWPNAFSKEFKTVTRPAKITPKRVETGSRVWDHTGKRISAYHIGMMQMKLISFQKDGEPLQTINREATK